MGANMSSPEPTSEEPRYGPTYRQDEIDLVRRYAARGESLCLVGVAGTGKSNLINYLSKVSGAPASANPGTPGAIYAMVDATNWARTPLSLFELMSQALAQATGSLTPAFQDTPGPMLYNEETVFNRLSERLRWACQQLDRRVMFVLDDFDVVFETGPREMLERLNRLRNEGNRERLSYLLFTKKLPHVLGRSYDLENKSKFFDLFRHSQFAMGLYTPDDARQMLKHLNGTLSKPMSSGDLAPILSLAGGHARLIRILFDIWAQEGPPGAQTVEVLAARPEVQKECKRVFDSLHDQEREVALRAARGAHNKSADWDTLDHLARRGLLVNLDPIEWFSPLMAHFLRTQL